MLNPRTFLDIYAAHCRVATAQQLQYRVALVIWLCFTVLEPTIYLVVWSAVASASGGAVGGFGPRDFAAYFIVTMLVNHLTFTWIMHEMEYRVRYGQFSPKLLRPLHPIHGDIADNLVYKVLTLGVLLPAAIALAFVFEARFTVDMRALALAVPALLLAFAIRFMTGWTLALAAFWTTRIAAVNQLYFGASIFLSGQMAPLALFPEFIQIFASATWFRWTVAFPVELILGRLGMEQILAGLGAQVIWLAIAYAVLRLVWSSSLRRFTAVGA
ncbi:MAG: ABC transporter permease [Chloroflexi bacterium]|nr:ABC transporter permease [Chloroflexota bacterium]